MRVPLHGAEPIKSEQGGLRLRMQVAKLRAYHYTAQSVPEKAGLAQYGLDLVKGTLRNNVEAGVIEPVLAKTKILQARRFVCLTAFSLLSLASEPVPSNGRCDLHVHHARYLRMHACMHAVAQLHVRRDQCNARLCKKHMCACCAVCRGGGDHHPADRRHDPDRGQPGG